MIPPGTSSSPADYLIYTKLNAYLLRVEYTEYLIYDPYLSFI